MRDCWSWLIGVVVFSLVAPGEALIENQAAIEPRGKKKKIALFVFIADLIVKKIFVLKVIYAIIFALVIHKAGYFIGWFVSYLKEMKNEYKSHDHHHHPHEDYGPQYSSYGPYRRQYPGHTGYSPNQK